MPFFCAAVKRVCTYSFFYIALKQFQLSHLHAMLIDLSHKLQSHATIVFNQSIGLASFKRKINVYKHSILSHIKYSYSRKLLLHKPKDKRRTQLWVELKIFSHSSAAQINSINRAQQQIAQKKAQKHKRATIADSKKRRRCLSSQ